MYICICNAITDSQIKQAVADGATTLADLQFELGVATGCGRCTESALELLPALVSDCTLHAIEVSRVQQPAANDRQAQRARVAYS